MARGWSVGFLLLFLLLSAAARSQGPPQPFADQRAPGVQQASQEHFRQMVDRFRTKDAGYEFAAHRSLGDPALLYGFLVPPDGADHPYEVFVVDGVWRRRQWVPRRVVGTPVFSDWEQASASQFCDGNPDGSSGWEAETAVNGTVRLMNDFVILRDLFDAPQTCWHEANHAAIFRGGGASVPAGGGDADAHHSYIIRYAERGVQVMDQLCQLEDAMAAVGAAPRTPAEEQQAWGPVYVRWRKFLRDWEGVEAPTPAQKQEYRDRTGVYLPEPAELARAYREGRYRGSRGVKPPAWVFDEGGDLVTFLFAVDPVPEGPWGDAWRVAFDVRSPQGRTPFGRPDRGVLTVELEESDPAATFSVTDSSGSLHLADAVPGRSPWTYDLAGDAADAKPLSLVLQVGDLQAAEGRELHVVFRYGGAKGPDRTYAPCEERVTVKPRRLARLKVTGPSRVGPDEPLLLRAEATDERGQPLPADPRTRLRWTVFDRFDYEGSPVDIPPRPARRYEVAVALFLEVRGREVQVAEARWPLEVVAAGPAGDPKTRGLAKRRWLQEVLAWLEELEQVDAEALRQLERRCFENHARKLGPKVRDAHKGLSPEGMASALQEAILEEQGRLHCMERPTEEHHQHRADLRATRRALEESRLAGDAFQEYAGFGDYQGYLAAVEALTKRFKVRVPEPVPRPAAMPWSYSLACSSDVGGVADLVTVKLEAPRTRVKPGEVLAVTASATGGSPEYTWGWSADPAASGPTFSFSSRQAGPHDLTVTATDRAGKTGKATLRILVSQITCQVDLSGPKALPLGTTARLEARVLEEGKPAAGEFVFRWQPDPEVSFSPQDSGDRTATATFPRPGRVGLWVQVLQKDGAELRTVAESEPVTVDVVAPGLALVLEPAQPRVGQPARARLVATPDTKALDVRWLPLPDHAVLVNEGEREITFYAREARPVEVRARGRTPQAGDDLGEAVATATVLPYEVAVTGPTPAGPRPRVWKEGAGLVEATDRLAVGQTLTFAASVSPAPGSPPLRYRWIAPEGCTVSNPAAAAPTLVSSRTGAFEVAVEVRDSRDLLLGRGATRFQVALEGMDGGRPALAGEARKLLGEGRAEAAAAKARESGDPQVMAEVGAAMKEQGWREHLDRRPDEAVRHLEAAVKLLPQDADAARKLGTARQALADRGRIEPLVARAHQLLDERNLEPARKTLLEAETIENSTAGMQSPVLKAGWDRFHAMNSEYGAAVARWEQATGTAFRALDWEGMLAACAEVRAWRLTEGVETRVAGSERQAREHLAEQQRAWSDCERIRGDFEAGRLKDPAWAAGTVRSHAGLFGPPDPRRQACLDLAARLAQARSAGAAAPAEPPRPAPSPAPPSGAPAAPSPPPSTAAPPSAPPRAAAGLPKEASRLFDEGRRKYDRGDLGGALAAYERGLALAPGYAGGYVLQGMARGRMADYEGAIECYDRALEIDPTLASARLNRGNANALAGNFTAAEADYGAVLAREPGHAAALVNRGRMREATGNLAGAAEDYRRALQADPGNKSLRHDLARVEQALKAAAGTAAAATPKPVEPRPPAAASKPATPRPAGAAPRPAAASPGPKPAGAAPGAPGSGKRVRLGGRFTAGSTHAPNSRGNLFAGGTWCNARNGSDWVQLDFGGAADVVAIRVGSASTDVTTDGARIQMKLRTPEGDWVVVEDLRDTNINRSELSFGNKGRSVPPYEKTLSPPVRATAFRLEISGHGWFGASDIEVVGVRRGEAAPGAAAAPTPKPPTPKPAAPRPAPPPAPKPPSGARVLAVFENRSGDNVHLFPQGQSFGPENRVAPGARREVAVALPASGRLVFVAGRNGQVLATRTWDGDPDHLDRYPHVVWDGQRLTVTTGLR